VTTGTPVTLASTSRCTGNYNPNTKKTNRDIARQ
jgi:hypothetical protein